MFQFYNIKSFFSTNKYNYIILLLIYTVGFFCGCIYTNMISDKEFLTFNATLLSYINLKNTGNPIGYFKYISSDVKPVLTIILFSFFLFGTFVIYFLIFKSGFSIGFFLCFLIKSYGLKGFFFGSFILFIHICFLLVATIIISSLGIGTSNEIYNCVFKNHKFSREIKSYLSTYLLIVSFFMIIILTGGFLKFMLLPKIINNLF